MSGLKSSKSSKSRDTSAKASKPPAPSKPPSKSRDTSAKASKPPTPSNPSSKGNPHAKKAGSSSSTMPISRPLSPHKHSGSTGTTAPAGDPSDQQESPDDIEMVWDSVRENGHHPNATVLAVVRSGQKEQLKKTITKGKREFKSNVIVTTPRKLQNTIDSKTGENSPLYLLVSSTINAITYHVSKKASKLHVVSCGAQYPNALRIGSQSTFCNFSALLWDSRPGEIRAREIVYNQGCHFNPSDTPPDFRVFSPELKTIPRGIGNGADDVIVKGFADLQECVAEAQRHGANGKPLVSPGQAASAGGHTANEEATWWTKWKGLVALILGAGAGGAASAGVMWCSAGGVFFKGPFGLQLAAGYINFGVAGGAVMAGGVVAVSAAAAVYLIPWDKVFGYIKSTLWSIWEKICDVLNWVWTKLKEWGAALVSAITG